MNEIQEAFKNQLKMFRERIDNNMNKNIKFQKVESWEKLCHVFEAAYEADVSLHGYVVFTENSFDRPYSKESRTYLFSQNNKYFKKDAIGCSLFAGSLDKSDPSVNLKYYLGNWKIEECGFTWEGK